MLQQFKRAENLKLHELKELFADVYGGEEPWHLVRLTSQLFANVSNNPSNRPNNGRSCRVY